ncbi:MAG TPA: hypothetical protein VKA41_07200 [Solirubrobacterales bacterium]|nr:hypothetical protein [Solirubrobacterales bacterium]
MRLAAHPRINGAPSHNTLRRLRPPRPDIAIPPLPHGAEWIGEPIDSIDRLVASRPVLVHFFDFAQLNSVRTVPYLTAWHDRYSDEGLAMVGVHSPRFPFTQDHDVVVEAAERLEIGWPVIVDREFSLWRLYEPHGWPALFLWGRGGALRWYHLGEGDYAGTEEAIREALAESNGGHEWPDLLEPLRPSDAADAKVIPPTPEVFPGGSTEEAWHRADADRILEASYQAGGAYAATDGEGEIAIQLDGEIRDPVQVSYPGLQELTTHERTERHLLRLEPSPGLLIYSLQFAPGIP